jgi:hypothetical protein
MLNIAEGNSYENTFAEDGSDMLVTYFLSERTSSEAPIIQRIVSTKESGRDRPTLHLFCRAAAQSGSSAEASGAAGLGYVYFGRLGYEEHDAAARPIRFVFRMLDYAAARKAAPLQRLMRLLSR